MKKYTGCGLHSCCTLLHVPLNCFCFPFSFLCSSKREHILEGIEREGASEYCLGNSELYGMCGDGGMKLVADN